MAPFACLPSLRNGGRVGAKDGFETNTNRPSSLARELWRVTTETSVPREHRDHSACALGFFEAVPTLEGFGRGPEFEAGYVDERTPANVNSESEWIERRKEDGSQVYEGQPWSARNYYCELVVGNGVTCPLDERDAGGTAPSGEVDGDGSHDTEVEKDAIRFEAGCRRCCRPSRESVPSERRCKESVDARSSRPQAW